MEELEKLRKEIDKLDKMIAELISKRQGLSNKILEAKGGEFTYDPVTVSYTHLTLPTIVCV